MSEIYVTYIGYELIKIKPRGPVVKRARYRWRQRFFNLGRSQSHQRKLNKQWAALRAIG